MNRTMRTIIVVWLAASPALAQKPGGGTGPPKTMQSPGAASPLRHRLDDPRGAALPDSVLARIPGRPDITRASFRSTLARLGSEPDSLTPAARRRFLDLLIEQQVLAARATARRQAWDPADSARYAALEDRLCLNAALDAVLRETAARRRAAGLGELPPDELSIAARESTLARLAPVYDTAAVARVARAFAALPRRNSDMSLMQQIRVSGENPKVAAADSAAVLATSSVGAYTTAQLLTAWSRLNPLQRPRVEGAEQVRDLVDNGLFERWLRRRAAEARLAERPDIAEQLRLSAEYNDVAGFVQREIYARIPRDSLTLLRHYRAHVHDFDIPEHARMAQLTLASREQAEVWHTRLADAAATESLLVQARRSRASLVSDVSAESDSALWVRARAAGTFAVLGPDSTAQGWRVAKVLSLEPARERSFEEALDLVQRAWTDQESERRMRLLLDDLRRRSGVRVNERALSAGGR